MIHSTAIVSAGAIIGHGVSVGPFSVVESQCTIHDNTSIQEHVKVCGGTEIGKNCRIFPGAIIGSVPQDLKFSGEHTGVVIGDGSTIREYVTINRGTAAGGTTIVGNDALLMAYVHVAHDCRVGDRAILSNAVTLAGHVEIGSDAVIGGMVPIHQFVRIGSFSMVGGGFRVVQDVPPFVLAAGQPLRFCGLNLVGLKRKGFSADRIAVIDRAYRLIYRSGKQRQDALSQLSIEFSNDNDIQNILAFFMKTERGVIGR